MGMNVDFDKGFGLGMLMTPRLLIFSERKSRRGFGEIEICARRGVDEVKNVAQDAILVHIRHALQPMNQSSRAASGPRFASVLAAEALVRFESVSKVAIQKPGGLVIRDKRAVNATSFKPIVDLQIIIAVARSRSTIFQLKPVSITDYSARRLPFGRTTARPTPQARRAYSLRASGRAIDRLHEKLPDINWRNSIVRTNWI